MPQYDVFVTRHEATLCTLRIEAPSEAEAEAVLQRRLDESGTTGFDTLQTTVTDLEINAIEDAIHEW